jgi:hypothetical protein
MNCRWCFWSAPFVRDFALGHMAWGVTSQFANFVFHLSCALFRTILLIFWVTQFTAVLHFGSLASCRNILSFFVCFNKRSGPGISYFWSNFVVFLVDRLVAYVYPLPRRRVYRAIAQQRPSPLVLLCIVTYLQLRYLAIDVFSFSSFPVFSHDVTLPFDSICSPS